MFCPQCGTETKPAAKFCHACSHPLDAAPQPAVALQVPPAGEQIALPATSTPTPTDIGAHPWRRFFARTVDMLFLAIPLYAVLVFGLISVLPANAEKIVGTLGNPIAAAVLAYLLWVPIEAALLANFGTTPAKWVFGIRVLKVNGRKLTFAEALQRAAFVCIYGDGFGVPIIALFTRAYAYDKLKKTGTTKWDTISASAILHSKWGAGRIVGATVVVTVALLGSGILLTIGKAQEAKLVAKAGQAQNESPSPAAQQSVRASNEAELSTVVASQAPQASTAQHLDKVKYHICLQNWHANNRKEWVEYIKRKTDLNGKVKSSTYWPDDASACDTRAGHATQPEDDGSWGSFDICFGKIDETCDADLANLKRVSEGYISAIDSNLSDYQHCIQRWQEDHHSQWLDFKDRWRDPNRGSGALKNTAYKVRPDLKACESRIPRIK